MPATPNPTGRTIITYGTFDLFHIGHVNILKRARQLGDRLIVAISSDEFNALKGKKSFYSYSDRKQIVEACRYVDSVIQENNWEQKITDIAKYKVNTLVMGDDWSGKFDHFSNLCEIVYLSRTPGISSSHIKKELSHKKDAI
jgi:glycerol-3-phosphate cytidylyltransferase